jgi:hypothetical protein
MTNEVWCEIALEERKNEMQRGSRMVVQIDGNLTGLPMIYSSSAAAEREWLHGGSAL